MPARRILLFVALALVLAGTAASLVPVPEKTGSSGEEAPAGDPADGARPGEQGGTPTAVRIPADEPPRTEAVERDERVVVTVAASAPGQVAIEGLGALAPVEPGTPAVFDLFTDTAGRFDVVYTPLDGPERRLGTLVVR